MKRLLTFGMGLALSILIVGAQAQKPKMGAKAPGMTPMSAMAPGAPKKGVVGTSTGRVKTAPVGKAFILTTAKGDIKVDISGAKVRNGGGQFVKASMIMVGVPAEATGQWKGKTLFASNVALTALQPDPRSAKRPK